jgi:hypothetical protein
MLSSVFLVGRHKAWLRVIQKFEHLYWFPEPVQEIVDGHYAHGDHNKSQHYQNAACEKICCLI